MSSWAKSTGTGRRTQSTPNGSTQTHRSFRRQAPYPTREDRTDEHKDVLKSYEELEQQHKYSGNMQFEGYQHPQNGFPRVISAMHRLHPYSHHSMSRKFLHPCTGPYHFHRVQSSNLPHTPCTACRSRLGANRGELCRQSKAESYSPTDRRKALYQKFYRQVQEEREPADCVVLSITNQCIVPSHGNKLHQLMAPNHQMTTHQPHKRLNLGDYPKSLGESLQERGLSVEKLYLQAGSGLTRALQDIRADGSPLCILVEQTNVALSSCTVIIFSESLKIHRNMPKEQAMDFVAAEYGRGLVKERPPKDPADMAARASQLLDDYLDREKVDRHAVPTDIRQLLLLLAEGVHLYPDELGTVAEYLRSRQDHLQASTTEGERGNMLPPGLGKPPPLLPTPPTPPQPQPGSGGSLSGSSGEHPQPLPTPLLSPSGSYPKTKPPPLLSLHRSPGPSHGALALLGPAPPRGPPSLHSPYSGPPPRGPSHHHGPQYHPGPRGPHVTRGAPPSLKSLRPHTPLLPVPGGPPLRPSGPRR